MAKENGSKVRSTKGQEPLNNFRSSQWRCVPDFVLKQLGWKFDKEHSSSDSEQHVALQVFTKGKQCIIVQKNESQVRVCYNVNGKKRDAATLDRSILFAVMMCYEAAANVRIDGFVTT